MICLIAVLLGQSRQAVLMPAESMRVCLVHGTEIPSNDRTVSAKVTDTDRSAGIRLSAVPSGKIGWWFVSCV